MYKRILIAIDGSDLAGRALRHGLEVAKLAGSEVAIVTVSEPPTMAASGFAGMAGGFDLTPEIMEAQVEGARKALREATEVAAAAGITAKPVLVENRFAGEGIIEAAQDFGADLIVMGSHGRSGLGRLLLGSQTSNVLAHSKIPVLVTR